uniref:CUB domain-containing protein n=1 Tax=Naja naja TaxID=35670 RepID=A0A8C6VK96_NAJNA
MSLQFEICPLKETLSTHLWLNVIIYFLNNLTQFGGQVVVVLQLQLGPEFLLLSKAVVNTQFYKHFCHKYIEIFDGLRYGSYPLGRTCSSAYLNYTYSSTSNIMTIVLHRDSGDSGNGFFAHYYSIPQGKDIYVIHLTCILLMM